MVQGSKVSISKVKVQREPKRLTVGRLLLIWCPKVHEAPVSDAQLTIWFGESGSLSVRFGRKGQRWFNELNQGTDGIPREFHYLFGRRITVIKHVKPKEQAPNGDK